MLLFGWWVGCWLGLLVSRVCVFCHFAVVVVFVGFGILVVGGFLGRLAGVGVICFCVFRGIGCGWGFWDLASWFGWACHCVGVWWLLVGWC